MSKKYTLNKTSIINKSVFNVIGVMSGTSLDGIDLCYARFEQLDSWKFKIIDVQTRHVLIYKDLTFEPLSYELPKMKQDSIFKINRNRWHKNLSKDIYMEEALNVLNDLNISYNNENTAQVKK